MTGPTDPATPPARPTEPEPRRADPATTPPAGNPGTAPAQAGDPGTPPTPTGDPATLPAPACNPGTPPTQAGDRPTRPGARAATSTALTRAQIWTRGRGFLLALGILLASAALLAGLQTGDHHGRLDPRSADPSGSRALAQLLQERGVTARVVTNAADAAAATGPGTTLLITDPDRLGPSQRRAIRSASDLSGGRTVLIAPDDSLPDLAPGTRTAGPAHPDDLDPRCALPAAVTAGRAGTGGDLGYTAAPTGATGCYPSDGRPTLVVRPGATRGGDTVLLGSDSILRNEHLAEQGNASLALQLLGSRPDLVWYLPTLSDMTDADDTEDKSLLDLVPTGWHWALLQLLLAAVVTALWRARRLGPLVTEKLPVAVRASESTEGLARLYRKADARDRAATVLRAAGRERLAALVGVPPTQAHDPISLVPAVSARLVDGTRDVTTLLFGTTPADDAALVALADHLDALEREVRTS
ncbi:DUF4350 domain-containing protein [Streptomyces sp. NPDC048383]|uniref:DUF4350 domain-containing protein n=1 Tax=Streptomyces sp. NPDC048383 TaxID=3155386 RepID=UPI00342F04BA